MQLIKEPLNVDFTIKSNQWTKAELAELSAIIQQTKETNKRKRKIGVTSKKKNLL